MVLRRNECGSNAMVTVQMTVEEYLEMKSRQDAKEVMSKQKNLVYGLEGIKTLFGCSTTTAWRMSSPCGAGLMSINEKNTAVCCAFL